MVYDWSVPGLDDDKDDSSAYFSPEFGNDIFTSAKEGWGLRSVFGNIFIIIILLFLYYYNYYSITIHVYVILLFLYTCIIIVVLKTLPRHYGETSTLTQKQRESTKEHL